jgi:hypothetical protein
LTERGKEMHNMKEKFNKDVEILKKNKIEILEMKSSITQTKKTQLKSSLIEWNKMKTEYQSLEIQI